MEMREGRNERKREEEFRDNNKEERNTVKRELQKK